MKLADYTTLGLGGPAREFISAGTEAELISAVHASPLLILGGGSNLVVSDQGFDGTVLHVATRGIAIDDTELVAAAGEPWDEVVQAAIAADLAGIECLSGIPGSAGATVIQNVGAYGQEVADTVTSVRVYDRDAGRIRVLSAADCRFSYRASLFRGGSRFLVLQVTFRLSRLPGTLRYAGLAERAGPEPSLARIRAEVLALRRGKGMVLDPADPDTRSAGSFFTNPVVEPSLVPPGAPGYPAATDGLVKVPAAWLIERAGFGKGYRIPGAGPGEARISGKHTLALVNPGGATSDGLLTLARHIRDGVRDRFGIELRPEPILVGSRL